MSHRFQLCSGIATMTINALHTRLLMRGPIPFFIVLVQPNMGYSKRSLLVTFDTVVGLCTNTITAEKYKTQYRNDQYG